MTKKYPIKIQPIENNEDIGRKDMHSEISYKNSIKTMENKNADKL
jgi:hypothetical protein